MEQRASERSSAALTAHLHNSTSRSQSQPFPKPLPALEMEACVDETGASQSSSPNYITGEKTRNTGRAQGRGRESKLEGWTQKQAGERRMAGPQKQRQKESSMLSSTQEDQAKSMGVLRTVCGCAGTCGCVCYLAEIAQQLHHPYLIY